MSQPDSSATLPGVVAADQASPGAGEEADVGASVMTSAEIKTDVSDAAVKSSDVQDVSTTTPAAKTAAEDVTKTDTATSGAVTTSASDTEKQGEGGKAPRPAAMFGVRHLETFLMFLCLTVGYSLRVNLSVAIVPMAETYGWDDKTKSTVLSSFFWGYVITQIPAGQLAERFGPKMLLVGSLTIASIFALLTPVFAEWGGWGLVCATRVIQGLSQGFIFPSVHTLLAKWAPVEERGRLATYSYAGAQFGTVLALPISGVLADSAAGWESCFYVFGALGLLWVVLWFFMGSNSPAVHSFIRQEERDYIEDSLGTTTGEKPPTPWTSIFTSVPLLALLVVHCGQSWGFWTLLTQMPTYMNDVLEFDLKSNGLLSALPYLAMWLLSFVFSWISDFVNKKQLIPLSVSRKLFNTIAHWGPACALIGVGYSDKAYPYTAVALLTVSVGLNAGTLMGFQVNHIDLSPNFAGTMMGITNCFANILSIVAPLVVGYIVVEHGNVYQWRTVFFIAAGIYFVGNLVFIIFGQATIQPWNTPKLRKPKHSGNTVDDVKMSQIKETEDEKNGKQIQKY